MRTIKASEARTHLSALLAQVERGEAITITRHGRAVARLVPVKVAPTRKRLVGIVAGLKAFRRTRRLGDMSIRDLIEAGRR